MAIPYTVVKGDYLVLIAKKFGIADWRTIYYDPINATFRGKRPNPNHIFVGDVIMIPIAAPATPSVTTKPPVTITPLPPKPLARRLSGTVKGSPIARSGLMTAVGGDHIEVRLANRLPIETWVNVSTVAVGSSLSLSDHKMVTLLSLASGTASFVTSDPPPIRWQVSVEIIRTPSKTIAGVPPIFGSKIVSAPGIVDWEIWM